VEEPSFQRLAILGLGLIGGSFALAARRRGLAKDIVAFDPNLESIAEASVLGIIEQGFSSAQDAVFEADAVILAAPVRAILHLLPDIAPHLSEGIFVMDLGSTKRAIVAAMNDLPEHVRAVGGHPMAGKEVAGFAAAEPTMFQNATFALCPTQRTDQQARNLAETIVAAMGARPLWTEADAHDEAVARISHLPYLMAAALAHAAAPEGLTRSLASTGYRDTSRLAMSDPTMMLDILLTNPAPLRAALAQARDTLNNLDVCLEAGDEAALRAWMEAAQHRR
jgi:prephenate dehydrogenase